MPISPKQFFSKGPVTVVGKEQDLLPKQDEESLLSGVVGAFKSLGKNIFEDVTQRGKNIAKVSSDLFNEKVNPFSGGLQILGQVAGTAGDVVGQTLKSGVKAVLPRAAEDKLKSTASSVMSSAPVQSTLEAYQGWKQSHPEAAADLEAVGNIASLLPIGKVSQLTGKAATRAAGTVAKGVIEPAADTLTLTGRAMQGAGKSAYQSAITPTVKEAERLLAYEAKTPFLTRVTNTLKGESTAPITRATTALEKGLAGTERKIGVGARRAEGPLWKDTIEPALKGSTDRITKDDLFAPALKRIEETVEPGKKQAYRDALEAIQQEYKEFTDTDLLTGNKIKTQLDEFTPDKVFRGKPIGNEYTQLRADMANAIRTKTYGSLKDQNIKKDYLDYSNLKELEKIGIKAISEAGTKGGFGNFWSSMWDMVTTPIKTVGGQVLYRVGNHLEFLGQKGLKRFSDFLTKKGFTKPPVGLSTQSTNPKALELGSKINELNKQYITNPTPANKKALESARLEYEKALRFE